MLKRLILAAMPVLALAALGTAHAAPPAPVGLDLPNTPIVLSMPLGYQHDTGNIGCAFAYVSGGGVLSVPPGFGGGTVRC